MKRKIIFLMSFTLMSMAIYAQNSASNRFAISTGFGTPNRFGSESKLQFPIHLAYENQGVFGTLPEYVSIGAYIRYSKIKYELTFLSSKISYSYSLTGFGGRASLDIGKLIEHISGEAKLPEILRIYGGTQVGYDIIKVSNSTFENSSFGSESRFEPFVGIGANLGDKYGLHLEFGNTTPAIVSIGASIKL